MKFLNKLKPANIDLGFSFRTVGAGFLFTFEKGAAGERGVMISLLFFHMLIEW